METEKTSYVRPRQAAEILSVSPATFWRYTRRPDFPAGVKLSRGTTGYVRAEIVAWARRQPANRERCETPEVCHDREEEKNKSATGVRGLTCASLTFPSPRAPPLDPCETDQEANREHSPSV